MSVVYLADSRMRALLFSSKPGGGGVNDGEDSIPETFADVLTNRDMARPKHEFDIFDMKQRLGTDQ